MVTVMKFTGGKSSAERIFDFGNGQASDNILIWRAAGTSVFSYAIFNGASNTNCESNSGDILLSDIWTIVVFKYTASTRIMELRIASNIYTFTCATARTNRNVAHTYVGKSNWASDPYSSMSLAGLYAIDAVLPEAKIAALIARMHRGEDPMQACAACPARATSSQGSVGEGSCGCAAGSLSTAVSARVPISVRERAVVVEPQRDAQTENLSNNASTCQAIS